MMQIWQVANKEFVIKGFGLEAFRKAIYAKGLGTGLPMRDIDHEDQDAEISTRWDNGADDEEVLSYLGTPVFTELTLFESEELNLQLQTVLLEVSQEKNIITTSVQGRNGTVKEYISDGDFRVIIRGALVGQDPYLYPEDQVRRLKDLCKLQKSIEVTSPLLQLFEIYNLVIQSYNFPQKEGFQNVQLFELSTLSDAPLELVDDNS